MKPLYDGLNSIDLKRFLKGSNILGLLCLTLSLIFPTTLWALRPMSNNMALVAGDGTEGFRDGAFQAAFFKKPQGLAIDPDGTRLFVADSLNNRIRVIQLDHDNEVTTLSGSNSPGAQNGPLSSASFNHPQGVVCLSGELLVVNDSGNKLLRLVDLKKKTVSILAGSAPTTLAEGPADQVSMEGICDMVYLPEVDTLFFTQPSQATLKMLDLKNRKVTVIPISPDQLTRPAALCGSGNKIYVADKDLPRVFQADCKAGEKPSLSLLANTDSNVLSLAKSGGYLYALQANVQVPLKRLQPRLEPVTFVSVWGDTVPDPGKVLPTFSGLNPEDTVGFVSDPTNERELYIVNPRSNIVTSFRDLLVHEPMEEKSNSCGIYEYEYPTRKPERTYRILLVGDSRSFKVADHVFAKTMNSGDGFNHQLSISKRMELELNTLSALEDAPKKFEVLNMYHPACVSLFVWPTYEVPKIVQTYDIDLVLIMQITEYRQVPAWDYVNYFFEWPITSEGIPNDKTGYGEYRLKPALERIPDGEPRKFYETCKERKLVTVGNDNTLKFAFQNGALEREPDLQKAIVHMCGKPTDVLNRKVKSMKTSSGQPVRLLLCYTPTGISTPFADYPEFWKSVSEMYKIPFLNLYDEMTSLRLSYYPISDLHYSEDHFLSEGHLFFGRLLAHDLIRDGFVPWSKKAGHPKDAFYP